MADSCRSTLPAGGRPSCESGVSDCASGPFDTPTLDDEGGASATRFVPVSTDCVTATDEFLSMEGNILRTPICLVHHEAVDGDIHVVMFPEHNEGIDDFVENRVSPSFCHVLVENPKGRLQKRVLEKSMQLKTCTRHVRLKE